MFEQQPIKTSLSLDKGPNNVNPNALYLVDFSKMNSVNDLVSILAAMSISFPGNHPHFELVKPFLNLENPIILNQNSETPQSADIKLPKLKPIK